MDTKKKILIIQTAFIGDVILATPLIETVFANYANAEIDFLLRKGNELLLEKHPVINNLIVWDKKQNKYINFFKILKKLRKTRYDLVINLQRFASSGIMTTFSKAKVKIGFKKNPMSCFFDYKAKHFYKDNWHEVDRNLSLLDYFDKIKKIRRPKLYPTTANKEQIKKYQTKKYICIAPTSVWFTKQYPASNWVQFLNEQRGFTVYLLGSKEDYNQCEKIKTKSTNNHIKNLAGELNLLQSAALMQGAEMNFVNDSAPLHLCSSVNAQTTAVFCSTVPRFGFYPLSDNSKIIETKEKLECRPCNLHGRKKCPKEHFKCTKLINLDK